MKRNLSSKWTLPTKIFNFVVAILPLVFLPAAYREFGQDILFFKILTILLIVSWSLFFLFVNYRLKFVSVDENNLYVSRLWRETAIPLSEIEDVRLTTIGFILVGVYFKSKTKFGKKIFFMPTLVKEFLSSFQRYHPVVDELKNLAKVN
ncbi:MAG: hypothetical protein ACR2HG_11190 [Pyrinomonadaceae bacterium]